MSENEPLPAHDDTIDGLRAVAALAVFATHVFRLEPTLFGDAGMFGVLLFFLISGYCIVLSLNNLGAYPIRTFLIRRTFRLYPVYWIAVIFAAVLSTQPVPIDQFLANLTMIQTALRKADINGVFWTLFIELIFYGVISLLLYFNKARRLDVYALSLGLLISLALFAAILRRLTGFPVPFSYLTFLSLFAMGGTVCLVYREKKMIRWLWPAAATYLAAILAIAFLVFGKGGSLTLFAPTQFFGNFACAVILFLVGLHRRWFAWKWMAYLGKISFCIYLFHAPIYNALKPWIDNNAILIISVALITFVMSAALHVSIEKPFIAMGRKLALRTPSMA